jgi:hypothetical protein
LRTMCGSRTGGWSLPCVMSDWQRCVEWFLAKYCRSRFRLDSSWCRWKTSVKGHYRWGLQVWRRKVGFVWGTRWPAGSSAGRMVARTTRWSRWTVSWLSHKTKVRAGTSWERSHEWWLAGGYIKFAGFAVVHQKTSGLLGWATKPRPKTGRGCLAETGLTGFENWSDRFGVAGRRKLRGRGHTLGSQGLRRGYAKCGRRASVRWCYEDKFPKCPRWACILV